MKDKKENIILQDLIQEIISHEKSAAQIELIKSDYPYLLNYFKVKNTMTFSDDIELVKSIGDSLKEDPHCPCMLVKNENTVCPCLPCRTKQYCHCGIFVPKDKE